MKSKSNSLILLFILVSVFSCNEPETIVTNIVHPDGSVTRKVEMRSIEGDSTKRFKISDVQVPLDSSWIIKDSVILDKKGDKTYIRKAEKLFKNIDEINLAYKSDSGANKNIPRKAEFSKRFKWFNTEYRFSERIEKNLTSGYPLKDFLNPEELLSFYSPESLLKEKESGKDSLKYKEMRDQINKKTDKWLINNFASEWITVFSELTSGKADGDMSGESLKIYENELVKIAESNQQKFDSLWSNGVILKQIMGEANAVKYKIEADSAFNVATKHVLLEFKDYSERIVMPGKLIGTNGFIDSSRILLWPVKADYFMTEPYEMWAESKTSNTWAWIVSGLFLLFVLTGVILRVIKKG